MNSKPTLRWRIAQWLEIRWWQNYLRKQEVATYAQQKKAYWLRLLSVLGLNFTEQKRILDAGCGPAGIFMVLDNHQVDAVDPLLDQYTAQLAHFSPKSYPWVRFHTSGIENYPERAHYDVTFCLNAINHVANWEEGLDKLTVLTRSEGTLVLGIDVHRHRFLKHIFRYLPADELHPHQHDREDYHQALTSRGWQIERQLTWKRGRIFDYWLVVCQKQTENR
jgi:2-polyprenyl-6-hydroxyphenyl methylase/3-demethylubiquinone-9 3-methyltransferase